MAMLSHIDPSANQIIEIDNPIRSGVGFSTGDYLVFSTSIGLDIRSIDGNTQRWYSSLSFTPINIDIAPNDKRIVAVDDAHVTILAPGPSCDSDTQVKKDNECIDCLIPAQFEAAIEDCQGKTSDGDNRFVNFEVTNKNHSYKSPNDTNKLRYSFQFSAKDYYYTGSGGGFSNYNVSENLEVDNPSGYTVSIMNVI